MRSLRYRKPTPKKYKNKDELRCQTMIKRGTRKPGTWSQCRNTVASNKRKYCEKHNTGYLQIR